MRAFWAGLLLTAIVTGAGAADFTDDTLIDPEKAIHEANAQAPALIPGHFALRVQAAGRQEDRIFLNSETDYRDQRNLTIAIEPAAIAALAARYGAPPDQFFLGKNIVVDGAAQRVKITFFASGRPTGKYYYQTHVVVDQPDQIRLMGF